MDFLMRRAVFVLGAAVLLTSCTQDVDAPDFDNPFDPDAPSAGSGYSLTAEVVGDAVSITFANVTGQSGYPDPATETLGAVYEIRHGTGTATPSQLLGSDDYELLAEPAPGTPIVARHLTYVPEVVNSYVVKGNDPEFVRSQVVSVDAPLEVRTAAGGGQAATRDVEFLVRTGVSTGIEFAYDEAFSVRDTVVTVTPEELSSAVYRVPTFASSDTTVTVWYRGRTGTSAGASASIELSPAFAPDFVADTGVRLNATRQAIAVDDTVTYVAEGAGVDSVTVRVDDDGTSVVLFGVNDPSVPFRLPIEDERARVYTDEGDSVIAAWEFVFEAASGLGFSTDTPIRVEFPGPVTGASIEIAETNGIVTAREIEVTLTAPNAGEFLLSESPDFAGAVWRDFVDTTTFTLSDGAGVKTLFVAFRNDFRDGSVITSATTTYVPEPPSGTRR